MKEKFKSLAPVTIFILLLLNVYGWAGYFKPGSKDLSFYMLDVGQGDALFFRTPYGQDILIDGGPDKSILSELGKAIPSYDRYIDLIILTHRHQDHVGGLNYVLEKYDVGKVLMADTEYESDDFEEFKELLEEKEIPVTIARKGEVIRFGEDLRLDILYPETNEKVENINNASVVAMLDFKDFEIVLPGDAEVEEWESILDSDFGTDKIEVLKTAHHGSSNGTTEKILEKIRPEVGLISSGKGNRYGHPHKEVLDVLKKFGVKILRTDENGTVEITSDGENYKIK